MQCGLCTANCERPVNPLEDRPHAPRALAFRVFAGRAIPIELYGRTPCNAVQICEDSTKCYICIQVAEGKAWTDLGTLDPEESARLPPRSIYPELIKNDRGAVLKIGCRQYAARGHPHVCRSSVFSSRVPRGASISLLLRACLRGASQARARAGRGIYSAAGSSPASQPFSPALLFPLQTARTATMTPFPATGPTSATRTRP